jgi:hypothetical protein
MRDISRIESRRHALTTLLGFGMPSSFQFWYFISRLCLLSKHFSMTDDEVASAARYSIRHMLLGIYAVDERFRLSPTTLSLHERFSMNDIT